MATRKRKGMIIKNTGKQPVEVAMATRTITLDGAQESPITSEEVRDVRLRELLQIRAINIVRPLTEEEEHDLIEEITGVRPQPVE
jgi:hypothetical protein